MAQASCAKASCAGRCDLSLQRCGEEKVFFPSCLNFDVFGRGHLLFTINSKFYACELPLALSWLRLTASPGFGVQKPILFRKSKFPYLSSVFTGQAEPCTPASPRTCVSPRWTPAAGVSLVPRRPCNSYLSRRIPPHTSAHLAGV